MIDPETREALRKWSEAFDKLSPEDKETESQAWITSATRIITESIADAVCAYDKKGHIFLKEVSLKNTDRGIIISFGWPCDYHIKDLLKDYPRTCPLCIDACGLNHKGHTVYIGEKDLNRILKNYTNV